MRRLRLTRKLLAVTLGATVVLVAVLLLAVGWFYSNEINSGGLQIENDPKTYDIEVVAVGPDSVVLGLPSREDPRDTPGVMGLEWPGGYGRAGEITGVAGSQVVRQYGNVEGEAAEGLRVRYDRSAFPGDPMRAYGIAFEDVTFASPIGELAAWHVPGDNDTWAIFVHGKGSNRGEALRMLPVITEAGLPSLVVTYRNDVGAPEDPSGRYQYGRTEWEDLQAAAEYAIANGASDLLLVGYSMGGGIVVSFLYQSPLADLVAGAILDSPMLDFGEIVDWEGGKRNLPSFLTAIAKRITSWRFDLDFGDLDYLEDSGRTSAPVLLFHGVPDEKVPVSTSDELAKTLPELVTYVRSDTAAHVGSWNVDPQRYENAVRDFVNAVTG